MLLCVESIACGRPGAPASRKRARHRAAAPFGFAKGPLRPGQSDWPLATTAHRGAIVHANGQHPATGQVDRHDATMVHNGVEHADRQRIGKAWALPAAAGRDTAAMAADARIDRPAGQACHTKWPDG